jgi:hypothetical protein
LKILIQHKLGVIMASSVKGQTDILLLFLPVGLSEYYCNSMNYIAAVKQTAIPHLEKLAEKVYPLHEQIRSYMPVVEGILGVYFFTKGFVKIAETQFITGIMAMALGASLIINAVCTAFPQGSSNLSNSAAPAA